MADNAELNTGLAYARDKQYENAAKKFTSIIDEDSTYADAFFYRGCVYIHLGEYEKAVKDFNEALSSIKLSQTHELPALYKRGYANLKLNQLDFALDDYRQYINQCQSRTETKNFVHKGLFQMGIIYEALNEHSLAVVHFTEAIAASKDTEEDKQRLYYLYRGRAYACCAKYNEAQKDLGLVIEESKDSFIRGCAYNELGRHVNARDEYDKLLRPNKNESKLFQTSHDQILFRRGLTNDRLKLHEQALSDFQSALNYSSQEPNSSKITDRIFFRQGMSSMALNNPHEALIHFNKSIELNKSQSDVFYARSMLLYTLGRYDAAIYDQHQAMELHRKSSPLAPTYKTVFYTSRYGVSPTNYAYYNSRIHETENLLKRDQDIGRKAMFHRIIAEYLQKQASYTNDSLSLCKSARGHIKNACKLLHDLQIEDSIALSVNNLCQAQYLTEKYRNQKVPVSIMEDYIKYQIEIVKGMSNLFDERIVKKDWSNLIKALNDERDKSNMQQICHLDQIRYVFIQEQLDKVDIIQETMKKFAESPAQQEFYTFLVIRLVNLFDAVRVASTSIFSHSLQGKFTQVSWIFKLFKEIVEFAPIGSGSVSKIFGKSESGFKKLDEKRITHTLERMGSLGIQKQFNETANAIAVELTIMYEDQIKRFPTKADENTPPVGATNDDQQQQSKCCFKCENCFKRQYHCLCRQKESLFNEAKQTMIQTIVEYGVRSTLNCLVDLSVTSIKDLKDVQNVFVSGVCRPPELNLVDSFMLKNVLKPKDAVDVNECWNVYEFFRRPAIRFKNGTVKALRETDPAKYGCRKPTSEEEELLRTEPKELDKYGFKIIIKPESS
ncbi:unnamed protein product [Adineta ricciae]|uniref:Uncharacterized protein n=1 Tax=Adineta ricciae TaxID=249248 RepID=A0A813NXH4_ADIRI|nr:unnamed protein product [Adineta ricciae]CAF1590947.1 unnamed protein product [Adineta ricciae]